MPLELFTNAASPTTARATTLGAAILSGATSLTVASSTGFPAAVTGVSQFRVLIESELFLVTNVAGLTWTVVGAQEGTTAAGHALGVTVGATITAGALGTLGLPKIGGAVQFLHPGAIFLPLGVTDLNSASVSAANRLAVFPMWTPNGSAVDQVQIFVGTGSAGALIRYGFVNLNTNWYPTTLISDVGTLAADTSGVKTGSFGAVTLPDRWGVAIANSSDISVRYWRANALPFGPFGDSNIADQGRGHAWITSVTNYSAALPASFPAGMGKLYATASDCGPCPTMRFA